MSDVIENVKKSAVVMEYLLGDPKYIGVNNRSRRVGVKGEGKVDTRKQIRVSWRIERPFELTSEQAASPVQMLLDSKAEQYINVATAKDFPAYNGKTETELTEDELLAFDGSTISISADTIAAYMEDFLSKEETTRGAIEAEYKAVAAFYRTAKLGASAQAKEAGDAVLAQTYADDAKWFTAANIKAVYLGTLTDVADARAKAIVKKVDSYKKTSDADANI